ncbi:hypothetical protein V492_08388 [Pseudogymnoascus sp. VKM F-4246]|nr:hypothetical protein V492_08388 [Pseudogymnoascus sp. VKM F-4246]
MADHLQPNDASLPRANLMAPFGHLSNNSTLTTTQPGHFDLATRPSIELGPRRQRRRLEYIKCDFCRQSKKKCEPSERQWPDEKCQRCTINGLTCSAPTKTNRGISNESSVDSNSLLASTEQDLHHEQRAYCALAEKCIQQMRSGSRINICELLMTMTAIDSETDEDTVEDTVEAIPDELRFLVDEDLQDKVYNFLTSYFLWWLESLSLLKLIDDGINSLGYLERLVNNATVVAKLRDFVRDAKRFILDYRADIIQYPLKIYQNALRCVRSGSMKETHIPKLQAWNLSKSSKAWGTLVTILEGHTSRVHDLAFSPDSKVLATASAGKTVKLWDIATQNTLRVLEHENEVDYIAFSPDGNVLASAGCCSRGDERRWMFNLWDPASGKGLQVVNSIEDDGYINSIAFSQDGKLLASASSRLAGGMVSIWNLTTGLPLQTLQCGCRGVGLLAFSPDGKLLALGFSDGVVKLWDLHIGCYVETFMEYYDEVSGVAFSSDSRLLASASWNGTVKIWDLATEEVWQELTVHDNDNCITSIAFAPNGQLVALASLLVVKLWNLTTGEVREKFYCDRDSECIIAFSPDSRLLACSVDWLDTPERSVDIWELHTATN